MCSTIATELLLQGKRNLMDSVTCFVGEFLSRAILDGRIPKKCVVCALAGSLYNTVNRLFTETIDVVL